MVTQCSWTPPPPPRQSVPVEQARRCRCCRSIVNKQIGGFCKLLTETAENVSGDSLSSLVNTVELWSYRPTFSSMQPFLRHNRGFTVAGSTVDTQCSCLQRPTDRIQFSQYKSGQFKHQTRLSVERDPNPASVNSCHQVKSFGLVHVVLIHDREWFGSGGSNARLHFQTVQTQLHLHNSATKCWLMTAKLTFCMTFDNSLQLIIWWVFICSI